MPIDRVAAYRRFRAALGAIGLAAMLGAATVAAAQTPAKARALALRYDVFIGGVYAITFDATVGLDRSGYSARAEGGTRGSIAQLFPWNTTLSSRGKLGALAPTPSAFAPARFDDVSEWQGKTRRTTLRFTGRGRYAVEHDPAEPPSVARDADDSVLPASLPTGAMDPFAAAIAALSASAQDGACARRIPVFDGKRRYDLIVRDGDGEVNLPPSPASAYAGPALSCRIGIKRISGYGTRRANPYWDETSTNPPTIWAADLAQGMPLVPVKLMAIVAFGTMSANLVHAEVRENGATRTVADLKR